MVKDKKNGECHRADKLICEAIEKTIKKKGNKIKADEKQRLEKIMQDCENYDATQLDQCIKDNKIKDSVLRIIPNKIAELYKVVPVEKLGDILVVATSDPLSKEDLEHLKIITGMEITFALVTDDDIRILLRDYYGVTNG